MAMTFDRVPAGIWDEPTSIPDFWVTELAAIRQFLRQTVRRGKVSIVGVSAGGRTIPAVSYGTPRSAGGTTTFSGSLGFRDTRAWFGPESEQTVYLGLAAVHGGEFEGIAGMVNLIAAIETGNDLKGKAWPDVVEAVESLGRVILIPTVNVDGRARMPVRMMAHRGTDSTLMQIANTGGTLDATPIGWPQCKEFIPMDFSTVGFPGGYPNEAGVNIQHDDFFDRPQPETRALYRLCTAEKPDLIINMHTGAPPRNYYMRTHRPFCEPVLTPIFEALYARVHTGLMHADLQGSRDPALECDPAAVRPSPFNLDSALNLHCGALSVLIESASHSFYGYSREGDVVEQTPEMIVDAQIVAHREAMAFLAETGGRCAWTPAPK